MSKNGITYQQVAEACRALLGENQKLTLRAIVAKTGGSPNTVLQFWKQWQREQEDITMAALDEELSHSIKQAILAECARKVSAVKAHYAHKMTEFDQQWRDLQALAQEAESQKQQLENHLHETQTQLMEQKVHLNLYEQRLTEANQRAEDKEKQHQATLIAYERSQAEKNLLEKQATEWRDHYYRCEQELKATQAGKHSADIEIAALKARFCDKITT